MGAAIDVADSSSTLGNGTGQPPYQPVQALETIPTPLGMPPPIMGMPLMTFNYIAISKMAAYENFSFEELRSQDYTKGNAGGSKDDGKSPVKSPCDHSAWEIIVHEAPFDGGTSPAAPTPNRLPCLDTIVGSLMGRANGGDDLEAPPAPAEELQLVLCDAHARPLLGGYEQPRSSCVALLVDDQTDTLQWKKYAKEAGYAAAIVGDRSVMAHHGSDQHTGASSGTFGPSWEHFLDRFGWAMDASTREPILVRSHFILTPRKRRGAARHTLPRSLNMNGAP